MDYYAKHASLRHYFYTIDTRGGLFLEETTPRNIATSLKDKRFLSFFYSHLRKNTTGKFEKYPYVSLCGREQNFLLPLDPLSALVYTELSRDGRTLFYGSKEEDLTGSSSTIANNAFGHAAFDPTLLSFNSQTGRLYYPVMNHRHLGREAYGLLHPHLCQRLGADIIFVEKDAPGATGDEDRQTSGWKLRWGGDLVTLRSVGG